MRGEFSDLFLPDGLAIEQGLHGGSATAHLALVSPICVILLQPCVQVGLQLLQRVIQFAPERNPIKLVQYRFVEALADAVCLGVTRLALGVFDAVDGQIQLVVMRLHLATVFRASVRQHTDDAHPCEAKKGSTRSLSNSAAVMGILVVYNLAAAHLLCVSTNVCW